MKKSEFLKRAWSKIDSRDKWVQGAYHVGDRYCMVGAIRAAAGEAYADKVQHHRLGEIALRQADLDELRRIQNDVGCDLAMTLGQPIEGYNDNHSWRMLRLHVLRLVANYEQREAREAEIKLRLQENPVQQFSPQPKVVHVKAVGPAKVTQAEKEMAR
jgi:hypothetical protein